MVRQSLPLAATGAFPPLFLDYIAQKETIKPFYGHFPTLQNFEHQLRLKQTDAATRHTLVDALTQQYAQIATKPNLESLANPRTFTVTTGHQLNIFTGPLYVIYKIVTVINLARQLKAAYPDYDFVPVYWMATEDHDFEEISYFNLFGKKYTWQTQQKGAVGRMNPRELGEALKILPERLPIFEKAYLKNHTLAQAVRCYMNDLFGQEGLVCIDGDDPTLKTIFAPVIEAELLGQTSYPLVQKTTADIEALGYHTPIAPREINLFYLEDGLRERIVREENTFKVLNSELAFSEQEIKELVAQHPEKFSPNVVLRPLYQELILPNLAYIGGPSEVPYWLQLSGVFEHFKVPLPILMPRCFALYVNTLHQKRLEKLGVDIEELFENDTVLRKKFVKQNTTVTLSLADEKASFETLFAGILQKATDIDKSLEGSVNAEKTKLLNALENLEKRLQKAEEKHYETELNQLLGVKNKLFPSGGLQERSDNFLNFYLNDSTFLQKLLDQLNPLNFSFNVLLEASQD
jgi:bacillithiol synthase